MNNVKKSLALALALVLVISLVPFGAMAATEACDYCGNSMELDMHICDRSNLIELWKCTGCGKTAMKQGVTPCKLNANGICIYTQAGKAPACAHANTTATVANPATCISAGLEAIICNDCNETVKTNNLPVDANAHKFQNGACLLCGAAETTQHVCDYTKLVAAATCLFPAYYQCECGAGKEIGVADPDAHTFVNGVCECGAKETVQHVCDFTKLVAAATCQFPAYYQCECGAGKEIGVADPDAHTFVNGVCACGAQEATCKHDGETYVNITEASCVKTGVKKTFCKKCDALVSEEELKTNDNHAFYNGACLLCGVAEAGCKHDGETYVNIVEASCVKTGVKKTFCKKCDALVSEEELKTNDNHAFYNGACLLCGVAEAGCKHDGDTYVNIFEASCVKTGTKKTFCKACDALISEEVLPVNDNHAFYEGECLLCGKTEHVCDYTILIAEATCQSPAYYQCECGNGKEIGLPSDNHGDTYVNIFEASCVKTGTKKTFCKDCDALISEEVLPVNDNHAFYEGECLLCGETEHVCDYTILIAEANCQSPAYYQCECGNGKEIGLPSDKHSDETYVNIFEASCVKTGTKKTFCKDCDALISEEVLPVNDNHAFYEGECLLCGAAEAACEHDGDTYVNIFEASCVKTGYKKTFCKACDALISEEVLPTNDNHAFYEGECLLCGETDECKHDYVVVKELAPNCTEAGYVWMECSICGAEKNYESGEPNGEHVYAVVKELEATCTEPGYVWKECVHCGAEKNHEVGEANGEHVYAVVKELAPTCTEAGYVWKECVNCGAEKNHEVGEPTGEHEYVDGKCACGAEDPDYVPSVPATPVEPIKPSKPGFNWGSILENIFKPGANKPNFSKPNFSLPSFKLPSFNWFWNR